MHDPIIIYNLFPRHYDKINDWFHKIPQISEMGFNTIYVNPFFETGDSRSLYAIKDYYKINKDFLNDDNCDPTDFTIINEFCDACHAHNLHVVCDLVINHTSNDSQLIKKHPDWYKWENGCIAHPSADEDGHRVVWGDLSTVDNYRNSNGLWDYWNAHVSSLQFLGFDGFRCDAAYQVSPDLWKFLINNARNRDTHALFLAETLGCSQDQINSLSSCGFDYFFNSVKYWNYDSNWALDQHAGNQWAAPSISFPESHDTKRVAGTHPATENYQKGRYAFAAIFSKGLMTLNGYESGNWIKADVVNGCSSHLNDFNKFNISKWIKFVNDLKLNNKVLKEEGHWTQLYGYDQPIIFLKKSSNDKKENMYVCINKQTEYDYIVKDYMIPEETKKCCKIQICMIDMVSSEFRGHEFRMQPSDIVLFV